MSPSIWVVSRRREVSQAFASANVPCQSFGGLLEVLRNDSEQPTVIAVDSADIDLLMADAALKIQRLYPNALLVALREEADLAQPVPEGVDEVLDPASEWAPGVRRLAGELTTLSAAGWSGKSEPLRRLFSQVKQAGPAEISVLITGESGPGKELVASALHAQSPRVQGPFVAVNTGAIPETLLESELFGHEKGAFTGATSARAGIFEAARGGTVFLDEIGDMPQATQVKLLRVIESRTFRRLGSTMCACSRPRIVTWPSLSMRALFAGTSTTACPRLRFV
jgi:DNA-binding NtrC family response regulator